jgi:hypothetical protein
MKKPRKCMKHVCKTKKEIPDLPTSIPAEISPLVPNGTNAIALIPNLTDVNNLIAVAIPIAEAAAPLIAAG